MAGADQPVTVNRLMRACYTALMSAGIFSFAVNMLMLTLPVFMFQVFDRVLASRSESTLYLLLGIAAFTLCIQASLDTIRAYAFVRISGWNKRKNKCKRRYNKGAKRRKAKKKKKKKKKK